ncbi:MAG: hypothetical protein WA667_10750 [Candidatus Nitrosopolaris sp.]
MNKLILNLAYRLRPYPSFFAVVFLRQIRLQWIYFLVSVRTGYEKGGRVWSSRRVLHFYSYANVPTAVTLNAIPKRYPSVSLAPTSTVRCNEHISWS